jgi:hypothetical protein|tara:strand:- start:4080 stop:5081 length:1002 start_codon:yes stop_codon:yes gene_type:complete
MNVLITGGCSYSQINNTDTVWCKHLQESLGFRFVAHLGHGAAGNAIISRKIISKVLEVIEEGHKPEDILVGIMWSGADRQSHYSPNFDHNWNRVTVLGPPSKPDFKVLMNRFSEPQDQFRSKRPVLVDLDKKEKFYEQWEHCTNPLGIRNFNNPSHYIFNSHWNDELTSHYFEYFANPDKAILETCEHILRTQWFLKDKGIKYFFTEYDWDCFAYGGPASYGNDPEDHPGHNFNPGGNSYGGIYSKHSECIQYPGEYTREDSQICQLDPEINYLYDAIDRNYFLPIKNLGQWAKEVSIHEFAREKDPHPSTEQHKDFTQQIILPFLLEKYNIQ